MARHPVLVQLVSEKPPDRPLREGRREGAGHLGGSAPRRPQAEKARPSRGIRHQPDDRLRLDPLLDPLVLRRQGRRGGRQDHRHQLEGDGVGDRVRQSRVCRRHGPRGALVGQRLEQPVAELRQGLVDPQPDQPLCRRQGKADARGPAHRLPSLPGGTGGATYRRCAAEPWGLEVQPEHRAHQGVPPLVLRARPVSRVDRVGRQLQPPDVARHGKPPHLGRGPEVQAPQDHHPVLAPVRVAGAPDERIQLITNSYIIPNMFAKVVSKPKEAILWAETEIRRASSS